MIKEIKFIFYLNLIFYNYKKMSDKEYVEKAQRKRRLTQKEIKDFALWAFTNDVYNKYTCGKIRQLYEELNKEVQLTDCTVRLQKNRWVLIDGKIYDKNKKYLIPD